mgnify:CR=1 FL=1
MGQIRRLPPGLVSRIAAGECIERPASVVKELVENSLDAGARRIEITIEDGGRGLIQVRDDGGGMDADDLTLSVAQHATSKIRDDDDLFNIRTLGFRGEALASIAAVARLRIVARRPESDVAHELRVEGERPVGPRPCAGPPGTTVEVRELFYNVPARRKFLRTNATEMGHITEQLARIALAQPNVAFTLQHQGRVTHKLGPTTELRQRIADFYGRELGDVLLPIHRDGGGVLVEGLVAPPAESRSSGKWEYVFVNGRYVRDRFVSHAVREAYRSLIDPSRFPVAFLFITIDPGRVDVNVHPTKTEVRWQDSNYVHGQVLAALRDRFLTSKLDHPLRTPREDDEYRDRVRQAMVEFFTRPAARQPPEGHLYAVRPSGAEPAGPLNEEDEAAGGAGQLAGGQPRMAPMSAPRWEGKAPAEPRPPAGMPGAPAAAPPARSLAPIRRALQVHNTYLVVETDEGVVIIDQHALHERILYEDLRRRIAERKLEAQRLLMPMMVHVPADRLEALETHAATLDRLGIELTAVGLQTVAVHAFPTLLLERVEVEPFVRDLLDLLAQEGSRPPTESLIHSVLDMMACKAAVKAGDPLTPDEIDALLTRRELAERSSHCPHGRPTTLNLTLRDLERQFHRR